jgi:hypothetical protein
MRGRQRLPPAKVEPVKKQFNPTAYAALQIEFEEKDRKTFDRIADAFESIAESMKALAAQKTKATSVRLAGESVSEPV